MARFTIQLEVGNSTAADARALEDSLVRFTEVFLAERFKQQGLNPEHVSAPYVGRKALYRHPD